MAAFNIMNNRKINKKIKTRPQRIPDDIFAFKKDSKEKKIILQMKLTMTILSKNMLAMML